MIQNAKIVSTQLGHAGGGPFSCWLTLEYGSGSSGQGFGGYALDGDTLHDFCVAFLKGVLRVTDSETWEQVAGKFVRVDSDVGRVYKIGHIMRDDWFVPSVVASELRKGAM